MEIKITETLNLFSFLECLYLKLTCDRNKTDQNCKCARIDHDCNFYHLRQQKLFFKIFGFQAASNPELMKVEKNEKEEKTKNHFLRCLLK